MVHCKICNSTTSELFSKEILKKYIAHYYKCNQCDFVQTSEVVWLKEAYNNAITTLDIGLAGRNLYLKDKVAKIIDCCFKDANIMLDFAGGYGLFVRLMRDKGYNFYRQDDYCENLFANYFDITNTNIAKFDVTTAFEVFEHYNNPKDEIKRVLSFSDNLIFSTQLMPTDNLFENWWYLSTETGQHIAFYSVKTLEHIAKQNKFNLYTDNDNLHIFTKKTLNANVVNEIFNPAPPKISFIGRLLNKLIPKTTENVTVKESLLQSDYEYIKAIINKK